MPGGRIVSEPVRSLGVATKAVPPSASATPCHACSGDSIGTCSICSVPFCLGHGGYCAWRCRLELCRACLLAHHCVPLPRDRWTAGHGAHGGPRSLLGFADAVAAAAPKTGGGEEVRTLEVDREEQGVCCRRPFAGAGTACDAATSTRRQCAAGANDAAEIENPIGRARVFQTEAMPPGDAAPAVAIPKQKPGPKRSSKLGGASPGAAPT